MSQSKPESGSESQREPEWESERAIESQRETGREPVRARENHRESQLEPEGTRVSLIRQPERAIMNQSESRNTHKPRQ